MMNNEWETEGWLLQNAVDAIYEVMERRAGRKPESSKPEKAVIKHKYEIDQWVWSCDVEWRQITSYDYHCDHGYKYGFSGSTMIWCPEESCDLTPLLTDVYDNPKAFLRDWSDGKVELTYKNNISVNDMVVFGACEQWERDSKSDWCVRKK